MAEDAQEQDRSTEEQAGHEASGSHETPVGDEAPPVESSTSPAQGDEPEAETPVTPLPQAEPGIYIGQQNAGDHALLGVIEAGVEYDYTHVQNPEVLEAIAAWVEAGLLEKKGEASSEASTPASDQAS